MPPVAFQEPVSPASRAGQGPERPAQAGADDAQTGAPRPPSQTYPWREHAPATADHPAMVDRPRTMGRPAQAPPSNAGALARDEEGDSKLQTLLRSRKFWTTCAATAVTCSLYASGELSAEAFADAATMIAGIYIGSVALEDGLRSLASLWARNEKGSH